MYEYNYYFDNEISPEMFSRTIDAFAELAVVAALIGLIAGAVQFILRAVGLYKMSKTLNIRNGWIAFIPFFSDYTLGKISDKYKNPLTEKISGMGLAMAILGALTSVAAAVYVISWLEFIERMLRLYGFENLDSDMVEAEIFYQSISLAKILLIIFAAGITYAVIYFISIWRLFKIFSPMNATVFLVLSIFIPFLMPVFIFAVRNNIPGPEEKKPEYPDIIYT